MKCNQIKERFSDYLTGEIDEMARRDIQEHVTSCDSCREELESLSAIWTKLGVLKEELPSKNLRTRFYATLEDYKQNLQQEDWGDCTSPFLTVSNRTVADFRLLRGAHVYAE